MFIMKKAENAHISAGREGTMLKSLVIMEGKTRTYDNDESYEEQSDGLTAVVNGASVFFVRIDRHIQQTEVPTYLPSRVRWKTRIG